MVSELLCAGVGRLSYYDEEKEPVYATELPITEAERGTADGGTQRRLLNRHEKPLNPLTRLFYGAGGLQPGSR